MDIKILKDLLDKYDNAYYNNDESLISDAEYDTLKAKYLELSKQDEYDYVPGEAKFSKFSHSVPMLSLEKVQIKNQEDLKKHIERLWPICIMPKFDGLTVCVYENRYISRGNGITGEDITENALKMKGIGDTLPEVIRGEALMTKTDFEAINAKRIAIGAKPFDNARNAAAGTLRNKDVSKVEGITFFAYEYIDNSISADQILTLKQNNWNVTPRYIPTSVEDALDYINSFDRTTLNYDIDGLVIKHNSNKGFGSTGHHPKNAVAIKFEAEGAWTTIEGIEWNTGRTGKVVPKAKLTPISVMGSTISSATLHNYGYMQALGLTAILSEDKYGTIPTTKVFVIKANDVIPAITEIDNTIGKASYSKFIVEPKECPSCKSILHKENDQLFCTNDFCESRLLGRLEHMVSRDAFNIEGLSSKTLEKIIEKYINNLQKQIKSSNDKSDIFFLELALEQKHPSLIYELTYEDILSLDGFAKKSAKKLYDTIQQSKTIQLDKFLYGVGVPLVGQKASTDIANYYGSWMNILNNEKNQFKDILSIDGIGETIYNSFVNNFVEYELSACGMTITDMPKKEIKKVDKVLSFVVTGTFEIGRKDIEAKIKDAGHKVSGSVSSKTDYLLASPGEENTSKYKKAIELETIIINSLEELSEIIGGN